jgi:hypothetical protein
LSGRKIWFVYWKDPKFGKLAILATKNDFDKETGRSGCADNPDVCDEDDWDSLSPGSPAKDSTRAPD